MNKIIFVLGLIMWGNSFAMKHITLPVRYVPKLNQSIAFLGLGTVELGRDWGIGLEASKQPQEHIVKDVLQTALARGMTVIDTAASYQASETLIAKFIPRNQHKYLLITKVGEHSLKANDPHCKKPAENSIYCKKPAAVYDFSSKAIMQDVENSLATLNVKQLDVVLLHLANETAEEVLKKGEALKTLQKLKQQNKIKYIGISVNGPSLALALQQDIDVLELEYSLINQTNEKYLRAAHKKGWAVIVRGGLGTGLLTPYLAHHIEESDLPYKAKLQALLHLVNNDYEKLTQLALSFLYANKNISAVIVGADRAEFIDQDIKAIMSFKDQKLLAKAKQVIARHPTPNKFTESLGDYYN